MKASAFFALEALFFLNTYMPQAQVNPPREEIIVNGTRTQVANVYDDMEVMVDPEKAWDAIALEFPKMGDFHTGVDYSFAVDKSLRHGVGAVRHCQVDEKSYFRERITSWQPVKMNYSYETQAVVGMNYQVLSCEMGVLQRDGKTYIYHRIYFDTKKTSTIHKMKKVNQERILAYCNYIDHDDYSKPSFKELAIKYALD